MSKQVTPCIVMNGNAREAIDFYKQVLDAQVVHVLSYGDMPIPCPDILKDRVSNAILRIGDSDIMLFDAPGQSGVDEGAAHEEVTGFGAGMKAVITLNLSITDAVKTRQCFEALGQDGTIIAPLEKVPFSPAFGSVTDKFGVTFILVAQHTQHSI